MKVLLAVHHFPPNFTGGAEWRAYRTATALMERGHEVFVVCVESIQSGPEGAVAWEDESLDGIPVRRLSFNLSRAPDPFRWSYDNHWLGHHFKDYLRQEQPEIFHLIGGYLITARPLCIALELGIPTVVTLTDYWYLCPRISMLRSDGKVSSSPIDPKRCARCLGEEKRRYRYLGQVLPPLMDIYWSLQTKSAERIETRCRFLAEVLNRVDGVISPSHFLRETYIKAGVEPDQITYMRQGRDLTAEQGQGLEKSRSPNLRVGYLGQIASHKGVHILLEASHLIPNPNLRVFAFGDLTVFPEYAGKLQKLVDGDDRLYLMGSFEPQKLSLVLRHLDVIVVPSLWYENSPNVILEAFTHRTPVIASNLGGMAELIDDGVDGLLFEPGNPRELAERLKRLIVDPSLLPRLRSSLRPVRTVAQEMDELEAVYFQAGRKAQSKTVSIS